MSLRWIVLNGQKVLQMLSSDECESNSHPYQSWVNVPVEEIIHNKMVTRFDYVKYDETATQQQLQCKEWMLAFEEMVQGLKSARAKALVLTKLEEAYMWIGKAIRDDQIERNGSAPLQEERSNK